MSNGGLQKETAVSVWSRAGDRTRTGDVQLGKLAFYQLNYARDVKAVQHRLSAEASGTHRSRQRGRRAATVETVHGNR